MKLTIFVQWTFILIALSDEGVVALTVTGDSWVTRGTNATLTCSNIMGSGFNRLQWRMSTRDVTDVSLAETILQYNIDTQVVSPSPGIDAGHYVNEESGGGSSYSLTIVSVTLEDIHRYWCHLYNFPPPGTESSSTYTDIRVPVNPSTMTIMYNGTSSSSYDVVAGQEGANFTCNVPGIRPDVSDFTWTLSSSSIPLPNKEGPSSVPNPVDNRLSDSHGSVAFDIPETEGTYNLTCATTNRQDGITKPDAEISVTLQVTAEPVVTDGLSPGAIAGIVIGCVAGVGLTVGVIVYVIKAQKPPTAVKPSKPDPDGPGQNGTANETSKPAEANDTV